MNQLVAVIFVIKPSGRRFRSAPLFACRLPLVNYAAGTILHHCTLRRQVDRLPSNQTQPIHELLKFRSPGSLPEPGLLHGRLRSALFPL